MNCLEFTKGVAEFAGGHESQSALQVALMEHAATCPRCDARLETERALTAGLLVLASDERNLDAPSFIRNELINAFESNVNKATTTVLPFPNRSNWVRWALAAAATIILGFVLFSARWAPKPVTTETTNSVSPRELVLPSDNRSVEIAAIPSTNPSAVAVPAVSDKTSPRSVGHKKTRNRMSLRRSENSSSQVALTEVTSEFIPLTYLNDATAMDGGIVVRVEIAREQLATLGLPFDLERRGEVIKADIILGDDGVARSIRLVQ